MESAYSLLVLRTEVMHLVVVRDQRAAEVRDVEHPGRPRPGRLVLDVKRRQNSQNAGHELHSIQDRSRQSEVLLSESESEVVEDQAQGRSDSWQEVGRNAQLVNAELL